MQKFVANGYNVYRSLNVKKENLKNLKNHYQAHSSVARGKLIKSI